MLKEVIEFKKISYSFDFNESRKSNLFLIHGASCDSRVFLELIDRLSKQFNIMSIDLNGHGESEGEGFRGVVDHAFICAELLEKKNLGRWNIMGHSLGGAIAMTLALYKPNLIESLILVATGSRLRIPDSFLSEIKKDNNYDFNREFLRESIFDSSDDKALTFLLEIMQSTNPKAVYKDWLAADSFDLSRRLKSIKSRCLLICGENDPLTPPKYHEFLNSEITSSKLSVFPNCGHWPFIEQSELFLEELNKFFV